MAQGSSRRCRPPGRSGPAPLPLQIPTVCHVFLLLRTAVVNTAASHFTCKWILRQAPGDTAVKSSSTMLSSFSCNCCVKVKFKKVYWQMHFVYLKQLYIKILKVLLFSDHLQRPLSQLSLSKTEPLPYLSHKNDLLKPVGNVTVL